MEIVPGIIIYNNFCNDSVDILEKIKTQCNFDKFTINNKELCRVGSFEGKCSTPQQNMMNKSSNKNSSSKYLGVSLDKSKTKWVVRIGINNKQVRIGSFKNEIDAAKARDIATKEHFGEYGNLNFPEE